MLDLQRVTGAALPVRDDGLLEVAFDGLSVFFLSVSINVETG